MKEVKLFSPPKRQAGVKIKTGTAEEMVAQAMQKNVGSKSILGGYKMERNIMVYIETVDNSPVVVSLEAIALAKKLSKKIIKSYCLFSW